MNQKHQKAWQRPLREFLPGVILLVVCLVAAFFLFANYIYHNIHFFESETIAPTCHSEGYTVHTCTLCGDTRTGDYTTAEHTYTLPYTVREPGKSTVGMQASYCTGCGDCVLTDLAPLQMMPVVYIEGSLADAAVGSTVTLTYESYETCFTTTAVMKVQGFTAAGFPKKNYNVRLYTDETLQNRQKVDLGWGGWGEQSKYTIKANYIDCSHARNIVSCRLFGQMVKTRTSTIPELRAAPNGGCTDGYPIRMYHNGEFFGIYTMNIPKDKWMFGVDENKHPYSAIVTAQMHSATNKFNGTTDLYNTVDWDVEYCSTGTDMDWLNESFNDLIRFVRDSDVSTFRRNAHKYIDIEAVLDYAIMCFVMYGPDNWDKNAVYVTYDGVKWAPSLYDADCAFGLHWNGQSFWNFSDIENCAPYEITWNRAYTNNLLLVRVMYAFFDDFVYRYYTLRDTVLSDENMIAAFESFFDSVGEENYEADADRWGLPNPTDAASGEKNNIYQIRYFIRRRMAALDKAMENVRLG
ncbi:MAG: CotH kinase family protein [Clostridia bacterium]|nr:CotH kinase family protein [Clostridia bacterium]